MGRLPFRAATTAILLVVLAAGLAGWGYLQFTRPGPLAAAATRVIPRGAGLDEIARTLAAGRVIERPWLFVAGARVFARGRTLKAGEYVFPAGVSPRAAMEILIAGRTVVRRLTVAEGLTTAEVLALVAAAEGLEGEVAAAPGEGTLLPETYYYSWGDSRAGLLARMQTAMDETLAALWAERAPDLPLADPAAAVTLASIVEKETARPEERPRIAAVFENRLRRGMRLDADPTVAYALTAGKAPLGRALTRADLAVDSPYNTYRHAGLPPGPIANPGRAAIAAVLQPAPGRDLYFVADGQGGHAFAATLAAHNRNVAKWRRLQRETGAGER